ncbi:MULTISPECIES: hypothetical protein [unclassified Enterococcus]|uniref:hypothetical protein n=1 Tax=unclassified Enterococcus TaxID=2608891 RepID=UPI003D284B72
MKKLAMISALALSVFIFSGCTIFGSGQSTDETTESSTLAAEETDITNSVYTLKVREDMDLVSGQISFKDNKMEWTRSYNKNSTDSSSSEQATTLLEDVTITTKEDQYIVTGKENGKTVEIIFTKVGNFRIKDESGNIYSL